ncbi:metallophosphoesterase family protein [Tardiphaga sp. P9-11]|uniref:metallophosphoesterase family protein n=1 Tax=Tardiphaga sp. P9-11 TaxID=2024614 RepID=UPI001FED5A81|nr:metallophosphoesterase family protein [Tardiphaga sp. P9-11]
MWKPSHDAKSLSKASLPDGIRIYAIGDIHGRTDLLRLLLAQIESDEAQYPSTRSIIVFLGDYIDRGPDSRGTIDLLLACARVREVIILKGNHETFIRRFLDAPETLNDWRSLGGLETLVSYGLRPSLSRSHCDQERLSQELLAALPPEHLAFFEALPSSFTCGDFVFVHAGIRPGIELRKQKEDDLLWIREDFLHHSLPFEKFVVHGHTPVNVPDVRSNRVNIDTGAFATGRLSCVMIEGREITPLVDIRDWTAGNSTRVQDARAKHDDGIEAIHWSDRRRRNPQGAINPGFIHSGATRPL